jgi:excisionase family DNA binding protein
MQTHTERRAREHRLAMNVRQAATAAGVGHDNIYAAIRAGTLDARKLGRRTIITRDALERFLATLPRMELPARDTPTPSARGRRRDRQHAQQHVET